MTVTTKRSLTTIRSTQGAEPRRAAISSTSTITFPARSVGLAVALMAPPPPSTGSSGRRHAGQLGERGQPVVEFHVDDDVALGQAAERDLEGDLGGALPE